MTQLLQYWMNNKGYLIVGAIVTIGVILSLSAAIFIKSQEDEDTQEAFDILASNNVELIREAIDHDLRAVRAINDLYRASMFVDRQEFKAFTERSLQGNPGIQAVEWIPRVPAAEIEAFQDAAREDGYPDFAITQRSEDGSSVPVEFRDEYFPVFYVEPFVGNEAAFGFDLASNATRLAGLNEARDSGESVGTSRITLVQEESDQSGFLVFTPIYRNGEDVDTVAQRREHLTGFSLGVFRLGDLVQHAADEGSSGQIHELFEIVISDRTDNGLILLSTLGGGSVPKKGLTYSETLEVAGREWDIHLTPGPDLVLPQQEWQQWAVLAFGLAFTAFLGSYSISNLKRSAKAEALVALRTAELAKTNLQLVQDAVELALATENQMRLTSLVEHSPNFIGMADMEGNLLFVNEAGRTMTGLKADAEGSLGLMIDCIHPSDQSRLFDEIVPEVNKSGLWRGELNYIHHGTGAVIPMNCALFLVDDETSSTGLRYACIGTDVSEQKLLREQIADHASSLEEANEELKNLDRAKDEFISTVSHELRTPLTSIKGFAQILLRYEDTDKETARGFLETINSESDRLTRMINDTLDLAKINAHMLEWADTEFDISEAVRDVVAVTAPLAQEKSLGVTVEVAEQVPSVVADNDRVRQVVTNIVSNAIKFTAEGGKIDITVREVREQDAQGSTGDVLVSVSDTGMGIAPEDTEIVFNKFKQVGDTLSNRPAGTGLGLPICKEIVGHYGGTIWVESVLGEGSTFFFTMPSKSPGGAPNASA